LAAVSSRTRQARRAALQTDPVDPFLDDIVGGVVAERNTSVVGNPQPRIISSVAGLDSEVYVVHGDIGVSTG